MFVSVREMSTLLFSGVSLEVLVSIILDSEELEQVVGDLEALDELLFESWSFDLMVCNLV